MKIENLGGKMRDLMPEYNRWLGSLEEDYRGRAIPLGSLTFREANRYFPDYVLSDSLIIRTNRFPTPPFAELGIPELAYMDSTPLNGVTYGKLIFIDPKKECMRLVLLLPGLRRLPPGLRPVDPERYLRREPLRAGRLRS
jgi:hypothetical protein